MKCISINSHKRSFAAWSLCMLFVIVFSGWRHPVRAEQRPAYLIAKKAEQAPEIDGDLSDRAWREKQPQTQQWTDLYTGKPSRFKTHVRFAYDSKHLYVAFRGEESAKKVKAEEASHDSSVWTNSCIEMYLIPDHAVSDIKTLSPTHRYARFVLDVLGNRLDQLGQRSAGKWNPDWQVATRRFDDHWQAEAAIPLDALTAHPPKPGAHWKLQIGRTAFDTQGREFTTVFPGKAAYRNVSKFGHLVFTSAARKLTRPRIEQQLDVAQTMDPLLSRLDEAIDRLRRTGAPSAVKKAGYLKEASAAVKANVPDLTPPRYWRRRDAVRKRLDHLIAMADENLARTLTARIKMRNEQLAMAPTPAITDEHRIFPQFIPSVSKIGKAVSIRLSPNEWEPASVVLWAPRKLDDLDVRITPLKGKSGELSAGAIDVKWVKCWYQGRPTSIVLSGRALVPELLLNNPQLVKVDRSRRRNEISKAQLGPRDGIPDDADALAPLTTLPARQAQQVWLTAHVPEDTPPGRYRGRIRVFSKDKQVSSLPLDVTVFGFDLAPPVIDSGLIGNTRWGPGYGEKSAALAKREMRDLARHGVSLLGLREKAKDLATVLKWMRQAGLRTDPVLVGNSGHPLPIWRSQQRTVEDFRKTNPPAKVKQRALPWVRAAHQFGSKQVYIYLLDEADNAYLKAERPLVKMLHSIHARAWVAVHRNYFKAAGAFLDMAVVAGAPRADLAGRVHEAGNRIYCYANPQTGLELPETYRRNYGLLLWQAGYDGAMDFGFNWAMGKPWDDFDHHRWKDHLMAYPTAHGLIDTIQWEGWREGVDDCRYLATLKRQIARAQKAGVSASAAKAWVRQLKSGGSSKLKRLDRVRDHVIHLIRQLRHQMDAKQPRD